MTAIAEALGISPAALLAPVGFDIEVDESDDQAAESAIRADRRRTKTQQNTLIAVYHRYLEANDHIRTCEPESSHPAAGARAPALTNQARR